MKTGACSFSRRRASAVEGVSACVSDVDGWMKGRRDESKVMEKTINKKRLDEMPRGDK